MASFLSQPQNGQGGSAWDTLLPATVEPGHDPFAAWADSSAEGGTHLLDAPACPVARGASSFHSQGADASQDMAGACFADDGDEPLDMPNMGNMDNAEAAEVVFYQYRNA